jgi:4-amino-4-deoxy-L-arabinose transferase-like glycosyltransferase
MSSTPHTATPSATATAEFELPSRPARERTAHLPAVKPRVHHLALVGVLALSAVLNTRRLSQNGYANNFYSAAVKSMLHSFHNFLFVSFDPGGLVTVDKPPLALWVQAASAKLFGFSPLSLLLPEAIIGVLAVAVLYLVLARRLGPLAALAGAGALAVFPSFVAVSRENAVDPLLILLMVLACAAGLRAVESGRWRTLLLSGLLVGLAFNTKTLAAYLVVPGIAFAYVVCAPGSIWRRALQLLAAGALMLAVSFAWIAYVEITPASHRPFVGSSTNNTELGLTLEYNGFGRVEGEYGGPGQQTTVKAGAIPHIVLSHLRHRPAARPAAKPDSVAKRKPVLGPNGQPLGPNGREIAPTPFAQSPKPLRLLGKGLGDQGGWLLPFAFFGLLAMALVRLGAWFALARSRRRAARTTAVDSTARQRINPLVGRRDPRLALTLMLGGWFATEAVVLSFSKGIVHPYYVSALAPGTGAMVGAGVAAFIEIARGRRLDWRLLLAPCAVAATVAVQIAFLHKEHYMQWFIPGLLALAAAALLSIRRLAGPALAATVCLLLVAPGAYSATTWDAPTEGTFPVAGPKSNNGAGGVGVPAAHLRTYTALIAYVRTHHAGTRWAILTDAADTASPFILLGLPAGSLAGYSGADPAIDGRGLAHFVARREARYVVLGGAYATRGGNKATAAVLRACPQVPFGAWHDPNISRSGLVLFDCAGQEAGLRSHSQAATDRSR